MERDLSFEALAEACGIDWRNLTQSSRGPLNRALGEIRQTTPELADSELAIVIRAKADTYTKLFAGAMLTPTALAKHWPQLDAKRMEEQREVVVPNRVLRPSDCETCGGDRMILHSYRPSFPTLWALQHRGPKHPHIGLPHPAHRNYDDGHEEYLPCPDCNHSTRAEVIEHQRRFERRWPRRLPGAVESNVRSIPSREE